MVYFQTRGEDVLLFICGPATLAWFRTRNGLWPEGLGMQCVTTCPATSGGVYCIFMAHAEEAGTADQDESALCTQGSRVDTGSMW